MGLKGAVYVGAFHRLHLVVLQTLYKAITMKTLPKAVAVVLARDKTNARIYCTPRMQQKDRDVVVEIKRRLPMETTTETSGRK